MQEKNIKYKRGVATSIDLIVPNDLTNTEHKNLICKFAFVKIRKNNDA